MKGILATKLTMSQAIDPEGKVRSITILKADPNVITQIKAADKDGYFALQLGLPGKPKGKSGVKTWKTKRELRFPEGRYQIGDEVKADIFKEGDIVDVVGTAKGKGFAGTVKRHGFHRGPMTHGHDHHRQPGSIGAMGIPNVHKGKRMAGRMGGNRVTVKNLKVIAVDSKNNLLAIMGAVPGSIKQVVIVKKHGTSD